MTPNGNREIVIEGHRFVDLSDLEDYCFENPEFEDAVIESGIFTAASRTSVLTYLDVAELEYSDGNMEIPCALHYGLYGEVLIDQEC